MSTYTIKPLKWEKGPWSNTTQEYRACVPFGRYAVKREREDWDETKPWGEWKMDYLFDEYYDEGNEPCKNAAEGKRLAWEHWIKRIMPALRKAFQ